MRAIDQAIRHLGSQAELARRIEVRPQEVNRWVKRGYVAAKYAPDIERETGVRSDVLIGDIPRKRH
jgi:DNA-binding transcriptional regulator YdaS (Cro superfamily)